MSVLTVAGPYVAAAVALGVAVWSDQMRRRDKRNDMSRAALSDARNVILHSWNSPKVVNASISPIRDVTLLGSDRFTTKYGTYIEWYCEQTAISHALASIPVLTPGAEHRFTDGDWQLFDPSGNLYDANSLDQLTEEDRGARAQIEWTDMHGTHWRRTGAADPVRIAARTPTPTFRARGS